MVARSRSGRRQYFLLDRTSFFMPNSVGRLTDLKYDDKGRAIEIAEAENDF